MSTAGQHLLEDLGGIPISQEYNELIDKFESQNGINNSSSAVRGRWFQVGSSATTTSIPLLTTSGLSLALSAASQSQLVGSRFVTVLGTAQCEAIVTAVSSSGTLTLDSALPSAPAAGTPFMLTPPEQTQLTGSNATKITSDGTNTGNAASILHYVNDSLPNALGGIGSTAFMHMYDDQAGQAYAMRCNTQGTMLASAARATGSAVTSPITTNYNARGVVIEIDVTAVPATGTDTLNVLFYQQISDGNSLKELATMSITASNNAYKYFLIVYPGASGTPAQPTYHSIISMPVGREFFVVVSPSNADSWTYAVNYGLIL